MTNEQRIGHLETKCKRLTLALSGMMVMALAMLFIAAKPKAYEDTIQARKLEVVDAKKTARCGFVSDLPMRGMVWWYTMPKGSSGQP